jgi:uncharacterized SAM-binding protein YcdF (DUF218 family)
MKLIFPPRKYRFYYLVMFGLILVLISFIPIRTAIARLQAPHPQAILTLGGDLNREIFTAHFAQKHPNLEIWISAGSPNDATNWAFGSIGLTADRVHNDRRAVDTLTNFTSLIADFKSRNFQHLYLITADYHMRRAKAVATFILGSQGIAFTPISIPTNKPIEPYWQMLRDVFRALLWIFTGYTGARLN